MAMAAGSAARWLRHARAGARRHPLRHRPPQRGPRPGSDLRRCTRPLLALLLLSRCAEVCGCSATVYGDDFYGWSATFYKGEHDFDQFVASGAHDNEVSSIKVEGAGCVAILYGDAGFQGWRATFTEGVYHYDDFIRRGARNDEASCIRVGYGSVSSAPGGGACKDSPGWQDGYGHGCKAYEKDGHCAGGTVRHEWITTFPDFKEPHRHCCICGGGSTARGSSWSGHCEDTWGWHDQYEHGCAVYERDGHCSNGHVVHEWVATPEFRDPHKHCCVCGKH